MTVAFNPTLDQLDSTDNHEFITVFSPKIPCSTTTLSYILQANRNYFMEKIAQRGVLLFRGFTPCNTEEFHQLVTEGLGLQPWNSFNNNNMPAFIASWLRKYSEGLLGSGDYRRYLDKNTVQLGPVESSIQGPHVEGGVRAERSRYLVLCCFEPAPYLAETGMVDLGRVYRELPDNIQKKYRQACNRFYYISQRKIGWMDKILLKRSPFHLSILPNGKAQLALAPCPAVCRVPETGELCLQPWAFAKNTNEISHAAAIQAFPNRGEIHKDSTADGMNLTWELCDVKGHHIDWNASEQSQLFESIFSKAHLLSWQKGDIALVDNIKIGHWRMNGQQGNRKLIQIQANVFNANELQA